MNTFKKKSMHVAVLAGLAAIGAAGTAEAVHINPDGLGQVLVYPYYTARAGQVTAISIINTQNNTKVVKVRFLEGKNSREVLDFNLFLSPADVWTGAVIELPIPNVPPLLAGSGQPFKAPRIVTQDNSCVSPSDLFAETRADSAGNALNEFKNYTYTGTFADAAAFPSLDRTREGYFEVIEMGVIDDDVTDTGVTAGTTAATLTGYIKHVSGVPANCAALDSFDNYPGNPATLKFPNQGAIVPVGGLMLQPPRGGLTGRASIINASTGSNYTYSPTAFDAWSVIEKYSYAGDLTPSITETNAGIGGPVSNVFTGAGIVTTTWPSAGRGPWDAMSATMMRNTVINEYVLDAATNSKTDWVVTFPTKRAYVTPTTVVPPFANAFTNNGSCDPFSPIVYNREEGVPGSLVPLPNPSPLPPGIVVAGSTLCWEANVVPFAAAPATGLASLLSSTNTGNPAGGTTGLVTALSAFVTGSGSQTVAGSRTSLNPPGIRGTNGPNGFMFMNFNSATQAIVAGVGATTTRTPLGGASVPVVNASYNGLPVLGFMVHNFQNTGVVSNYGAVVDHKYTRSITP